MASKNSLPEGKFKIDPESNTGKVLETIRAEYADWNPEKNGYDWSNEKAKEEYEYLEKALKNVDDEGSRKYIISKRLGIVPEFSHNNLPMLDEYRDLKWQEDFKSPTWDNIDKIEPGFFDPKSPNYFGNMPKETLALYQQKMGIDDADSFWNKASEEEVKRTRHKIAHGEDEGGWFDSPTAFAHNLGGATLILFSPRVQEAIERGEDPTLKDYALDATENAAYTYMPIGKAVRPFGKAASLLGTNVGNPLAMEAIDALVYGDESNSDRKKFSTGDVLAGSLINTAMGGIGNRIKGGEKFFTQPGERTLKIGDRTLTVDENVFQKLKNNPEFMKNVEQVWKYDDITKGKRTAPSRQAMTPDDWKKFENPNDLKLLQEQEWQKFKTDYPEAAKSLEAQDKFWLETAQKGKNKFGDKLEDQAEKASTYKNKVNITGEGENKLGVGSFVSNKTGDEANRHKRTRDLLMKQGVREWLPAGTSKVIYPLMNWDVDISNKDKLEELLGNY